MFGVEFNYNPVRFMTLTAQYQFNAGRDPLKMLLWPNSTAEIPNSAAYLLGARLRIPWQGGYLKGDLCGVYSEPFDMILANDHISYIYHRPSNSSYSGDPVQEWIGFSEGPDCILGSATIGYQTASHAVATLSASYRWKGMNDLSTVYAKTTANAALRTPTGIVEGRLRVGANFSLPFGERWKASAAAYYTSRVNAQNHLGTADQSVELMGGIGLSLP